MNMAAAIWKNQKIIPILIILRMKWERFIYQKKENGWHYKK